jgi:hypothetical protein
MSVPIYGPNDIYIIRSDQCDCGWSVHLHGAEDSWVSSRLGIDGFHPFFHLRAIVARSPHAVPRGGRTVRPAGAVTAVSSRVLRE